MGDGNREDACARLRRMRTEVRGKEKAFMCSLFFFWCHDSRLNYSCVREQENINLTLIRNSDLTHRRHSVSSWRACASFQRKVVQAVSLNSRYVECIFQPAQLKGLHSFYLHPNAYKDRCKFSVLKCPFFR